MSLAATLVTALVILLHVVFAYAESFGWGQMARRFGYDADRIEKTRMLATNQGAYNFCLAGVLAWALISGEVATVAAILVYVIAMSIVGGLTVKPTILAIQGAPAMLALVLVWLG